MNHKVSVIIPTYNEEEHISNCLDSLLIQTYKDYEVIVVDDGSTDSTLSQIETKKVKLYQQNHKGAGAARNLGAKNSNGDILVFIDADMIATQDFLKDLVQPIIQGKSKGTFTKNEVVLNYENTWAKLYNWEYVKEKSKYRIPSHHPDKSNVLRAILKTEFNRVGGYNEVGYGEDWTLSNKLGYMATSTQALVLHKNPRNASQVFNQASWIATRNYKAGELGRFIALIRASLPVSLTVGLLNAIKYRHFFYPIFKLVFDFGIFYGIIKFWSTKKYAQ